MKTVIRPETEMKDSGIEWIGVIPKEWSIIKGKYIYFVQAGYPFNSEYFSLIKGMPLIRIRDITSGKCETYFDGDYLDEYVVNNTDLLIGMDGDFNVRWWESGQAVLNQRCCRIIEKNNISRKYLYYALPFGLKELNDLTYFTTVKHLSNNGILNLNFPFPPLSEQQAIANYLDATCSKIDEIIAEAKASIDEYKELKQSVIFEAVTKGLDKNVEMKDSGVEWIGAIPASWEYKKIRYIVNDIGDIDHYMPESVGRGIAYLMTGDLSDKVSDIDFEKCKQVSYENYKRLSKKINAEIGDIIFARYASVGVVCYVDVNKEFLVSYSCVVIKPKHDDINSLYIKYYLQSKAFKEEVLRLANSNVQTNVGKESLLQAKITVPPLYEQEEIVNYLNKKIMEIDSLIAEKESLINDLEAYKKSLIYEVVTGKRKVV